MHAVLYSYAFSLCDGSSYVQLKLDCLPIEQMLLTNEC